MSGPLWSGDLTVGEYRCRVMLWPDAEAMRAYLRKKYPKTGHYRDTVAAFCRSKRFEFLGETHFHLAEIGAGIVTHEIIHAVAWYARRCDLLSLAHDERWAECGETLARQLTSAWIAQGVYDAQDKGWCRGQ